MISSSLCSNSAVEARLRELREQEAAAKEAAVKARAKQEEERIELVRRTVESESVNWEAELLFQLEKHPELGVKCIELSQNKFGKSMDCHRQSYQKVQAFQADSLNLNEAVYDIQTGFLESNIPADFTVANERARLRIRVLSRVIQSRVYAAANAANAAAQKERELAQVAAAKEEALRAAWIEDNRIKMNMLAASLLNDSQTVMHNYTDFKGPETLFVVYKVSKEGIGSIDVRRLTINGFQPVFVKPSMCDFSSSHGLAPPITIPESWADHYDAGKTPFLTVCPICKKSPQMWHIDWKTTYGDVECKGHYKWDAATNTHSKNTSGYYVHWNPKDPDGKLAAEERRKKELAETEAAIQKLMIKAAALK
jgi:hypothetical protein